MSADFAMTEIELRVLAEARQVLRDNLAAYLLSGLGETSLTHRRAFTALSISGNGEDVTYEFQMINNSVHGLPRGRDPLVLAVLLLLLQAYRSVSSTVRFTESVVVETLGWPDNYESNAEVRTALERYLLTGFYLIDPTVAEEYLIFGRYARFRRLLVGYEATWLNTPLRKEAHNGPNQFLYLPEFAWGEMLGLKRFLGVDFRTLREMQEIPC